MQSFALRHGPVEQEHAILHQHGLLLGSVSSSESQLRGKWIPFPFPLPFLHLSVIVEITGAYQGSSRETGTSTERKGVWKKRSKNATLLSRLGKQKWDSIFRQTVYCVYNWLLRIFVLRLDLFVAPWLHFHFAFPSYYSSFFPLPLSSFFSFSQPSPSVSIPWGLSVQKCSVACGYRSVHVLKDVLNVLQQRHSAFPLGLGEKR